MSYLTFRDAVSSQFSKFVAANRLLLAVNVDGDKLWEAYLEAFPEDKRQYSNCSTCRNFIRQLGGVVVIKEEGRNLSLETIWDTAFQIAGDYAAPISAVRRLVLESEVRGRLVVEQQKIGHKQNFDALRSLTWDHFYAVVPEPYTAKSTGPRLRGELDTTKHLFLKGMALEASALDMTIELMEANSIHRSEQFLEALKAFRALHETYHDLRDTRDRELMAWRTSVSSESLARTVNTSVGTLLQDLSEGKELNAAVASFEKIVGGDTYMRTTAVVTPRMIAEAQSKLEALGMTPALHRRRLDTRDVTADRALFSYRPTTKATSDVFAELKEGASAKVDKAAFARAIEIPIDKFLSDVIPTADVVELMFDHSMLGKLVTLTGPQDPEAPNMMLWDNSFAWSYTGGVAEAIKDRVKLAGGKVDGWMRISLAWHNYDDLDLSLHSPLGRVDYVTKHSKSLTATLDVDANGGHATTRKPVENIDIARALPAGEYTVGVTQYVARERSDVGYTLEVETQGVVKQFSSSKHMPTGQCNRFTIKVNALGDVTFDDALINGNKAPVTKWGVTTDKWHKVNCITLSPNYWSENPQRLKQYMFLLAGCVSDEVTQPFINEFLCRDLAANRKVMEALSSKCEVLPADGAELSGVGFSASVPAEFYVRVTGATTRIFKVKV